MEDQAGSRCARSRAEAVEIDAIMVGDQPRFGGKPEANGAVAAAPRTRRGTGRRARTAGDRAARSASRTGARSASKRGARAAARHSRAGSSPAELRALARAAARAGRPSRNGRGQSWRLALSLAAGPWARPRSRMESEPLSRAQQKARNVRLALGDQPDGDGPVAAKRGEMAANESLGRVEQGRAEHGDRGPGVGRWSAHCPLGHRSRGGIQAESGSGGREMSGMEESGRLIMRGAKATRRRIRDPAGGAARLPVRRRPAVRSRRLATSSRSRCSPTARSRRRSSPTPATSTTTRPPGRASCSTRPCASPRSASP